MVSQSDRVSVCVPVVAVVAVVGGKKSRRHYEVGVMVSSGNCQGLHDIENYLSFCMPVHRENQC